MVIVEKVKYFVCLFFVCVSLSVYSQNENARGRDDSKDIVKSPKVSKLFSRREYKKTFRYKYFKYHSDLIDQYHRRMKKVRNDRKRMARIMEKPKYSDPSYFGHNRKPKKRTGDKMKLCKECGIRH